MKKGCEDTNDETDEDNLEEDIEKVNRVTVNNVHLTININIDKNCETAKGKNRKIYLNKTKRLLNAITSNNGNYCTIFCSIHSMFNNMTVIWLLQINTNQEFCILVRHFTSHTMHYASIGV